MKTKTLIIIIAFLLLTSIPKVIDILLNGFAGYKGYDLTIIVLYVLFGPIALYKGIQKLKKEKQGLKTEDELSRQMKYKSGYYAYLYSLTLWMFLFFIKDVFPNTDIMMAVGIILSVIIGIISKISISNNFNEK
jgi:uncharacterized membrane-anchored protein